MTCDWDSIRDHTSDWRVDAAFDLRVFFFPCCFRLPTLSPITRARPARSTPSTKTDPNKGSNMPRHTKSPARSHGHICSRITAQKETGPYLLRSYPSRSGAWLLFPAVLPREATYGPDGYIRTH